MYKYGCTPSERYPGRCAECGEALECQRCEGCEVEGYFTSGLPGVLAHVENGQIQSGVERCDLCQRYPSDEAAIKALESYLKEM